MAFDGLLAHEQRGGDLAVGAAEGDQIGDLALAPAQCREALSGRARRWRAATLTPSRRSSRAASARKSVAPRAASSASARLSSARAAWRSPARPSAWPASARRRAAWTGAPTPSAPWFHLAYWLGGYAVLVASAPAVLVWQERRQGGRLPVWRPLSAFQRGAGAFAGMAMAAAGLALLASPAGFSDVWPWELAPLTARLLGVWLAAFAAAYGGRCGTASGRGSGRCSSRRRSPGCCSRSCRRRTPAT